MGRSAARPDGPHGGGDFRRDIVGVFDAGVDQSGGVWRDLLFNLFARADDRVIDLRRGHAEAFDDAVWFAARSGSDFAGPRRFDWATCVGAGAASGAR